MVAHGRWNAKGVKAAKIGDFHQRTYHVERLHSFRMISRFEYKTAPVCLQSTTIARRRVTFQPIPASKQNASSYRSFFPKI